MHKKTTLLPSLHPNKPCPSPRQALWVSGGRKNHRGHKLTLTIGETMSSRLEPEMEQKTKRHCSANTLTASDLGPELPRSVRGGTGAREVTERLHGRPSAILPESLHPWDGKMNHGWPSARPGPGLSPPPYFLFTDPLLSLEKHDKFAVYLLKKTWRKSKGAGKKLCKIDRKLVVPALLLLFLVWAAEEI